MSNQKSKNMKLAKMAMLVAISIVLVVIIHFPIFPAVAFLEYDPADIPILIGTFAFGPGAGIVLVIVTSVIQGLTVSAQSGVYGIIMHILATTALAAVAGLIYKKNKTKKSWRGLTAPPRPSIIVIKSIKWVVIYIQNGTALLEKCKIENCLICNRFSVSLPRASPSE